VILDAGCGSGYTSLCLAEANPGCKIIGIDISEESLKLARERLKYHGFDNVEFRCLFLEELPALGIEFDYINAHELLSILPDVAGALATMRAILKPDGIIRTNIHSYFQRASFYRAQTLFKMMGLMDSNPEDLEVEFVKDFFKGLKNNVKLKSECWLPHLENSQQYYLMNFLLQGDKGVTIPELFDFLRSADLEFISMVNWREWNVVDLFADPENLPAFLALTLPEATIEDELRLYELINPYNRLFDFWCGNYQEETEAISYPVEWMDEEWQTVKVHLHPLVNTDRIKNILFDSIKNLQPFEIGKYWPMIRSDIIIDNSLAASVLPPLFESPQSFNSLVQRWQALHPIDPLTLEPTSTEEAFTIIREFLIAQESLDYILLERLG
jgi:SAM-dependent methyltransferase